MNRDKPLEADMSEERDRNKMGGETSKVDEEGEKKRDRPLHRTVVKRNAKVYFVEKPACHATEGYMVGSLTDKEVEGLGALMKRECEGLGGTG